MSALRKLAAALALSVAWAAPAQAMYYYLHPGTKHLVIEAGGAVEEGDSNRFLTLLNKSRP